MHAAETALGGAIAGLYEAFAGHPLPAAIDACAHCQHDDGAIRRRPLRLLEADDLSDYAFCALSTWGDADAWRHFLPRILELHASHAPAFPDLAVTAGKLPLAGWREWPAEEREAVEAYLHALWVHELLAPPEVDDPIALPGRLEDVLQALGCAFDDIGPFLRTWASLDGEWPMRRLAAFATNHHAEILKHGRIRLPWWDDRPEAGRSLLAWIVGPDPSHRLTHTLEKTTRDEVWDEFTVALDCLAGIRRRIAT